MNREVKFRAWDIKKQYMEYGSNSLIFDCYGMRLDCVMQYTGLKDIDGKEIYEGDVVKVDSFYETHYAKVIWGLVHSMCTWANGETWLLHFANGNEGAAYPYCQERNGERTVVIGNIYENPELLEVA